MDSRPCRTNAQSSNFFEDLISASVTGSSRPANSRSTTAVFRIFRVVARFRFDIRETDDARNAAAMINEDAIAWLHLADGAHRLRIGDAVPSSAPVAFEVVD